MSERRGNRGLEGALGALGGTSALLTDPNCGVALSILVAGDKLSQNVSNYAPSWPS